MRGDEAERERVHVFCVFEERDRDVSGEKRLVLLQTHAKERERKKMTFFSHSARTLKGSKRRFYVYDASREESYAASLLFFPRDILSRVFVDVSLRAPPRGKED